MLIVDDVSLTLNHNPVITGLSLSLFKGEIHALLGLNGTGKSTLAYMIIGISGYRPKSGSIIFEGNDITDLPVYQRARLGITLAWQEPARFEGLTIHEYLSLAKRRPDAGDACLNLVGFDPKLYYLRFNDKTLSGGERKKVELASVYCMRPKLAILDEPDSGIDPLSLPEILSVVQGMNSDGATILAITHREEIVQIADRVSVLCGGKIQHTGMPDETFNWFRGHCKICPHVNEPERNEYPLSKGI